MYLEDRFEITDPAEPNQLNFMTWGDVNLSEDGVVKIAVNNKIVRLLYDKNTFDAVVEPVEIDDKRLSDVWGNKIYRISLNASKISNKGIYKVIVKS